MLQPWRKSFPVSVVLSEKEWSQSLLKQVNTPQCTISALFQEGQLSNIVIDSPFLFGLQLVLEISIILLILKELFLLWGQVKVHEVGGHNRMSKL